MGLVESNAIWIWDKGQDRKLALKGSSHHRRDALYGPKLIPSLSVAVWSLQVGQKRNSAHRCLLWPLSLPLITPVIMWHAGHAP